MLLFTFLGVASEVGMPQASAGNFETLAVTDFLQLGDDEKWEKSYNTSLGKFKIRFRKLLWSSDAKRYHLIIWWNDKRITDGYCPENGYGYAFRVFHDEATDRLFVVINSVGHAVMFGYDPINKKMEKFVDSNNYYNNGKYPYIKEGVVIRRSTLLKGQRMPKVKVKTKWWLTELHKRYTEEECKILE